MLNVGLSDHPLIYCTRKVARIKIDAEIEIKLHSLENYTVDGYEKRFVGS